MGCSAMTKEMNRFLIFFLSLSLAHSLSSQGRSAKNATMSVTTLSMCCFSAWTKCEPSAYSLDRVVSEGSAST